MIKHVEMKQITHARYIDDALVAIDKLDWDLVVRYNVIRRRLSVDWIELLGQLEDAGLDMVATDGVDHSRSDTFFVHPRPNFTEAPAGH